jgi:hypothetical protein
MLGNYVANRAITGGRKQRKREDTIVRTAIRGVDELEIDLSIVVEVEQVTGIRSDDAMGWRVNNPGLRRLGQRKQAHPRCACREHIQVELVMN